MLIISGDKGERMERSGCKIHAERRGEMKNVNNALWAHARPDKKPNERITCNDSGLNSLPNH